MIYVPLGRYLSRERIVFLIDFLTACFTTALSELTLHFMLYPQVSFKAALVFS